MAESLIVGASLSLSEEENIPAEFSLSNEEEITIFDESAGLYDSVAYSIHVELSSYSPKDIIVEVTLSGSSRAVTIYQPNSQNYLVFNKLLQSSSSGNPRFNLTLRAFT